MSDEQAKATVKQSPLGAFARTAFKPITKAGDPGPLASKYGGVPWLREGEAWPSCPNCSKPMHLVLQLDLATLPEPRKGIFQFFACTSSTPLCEVDTEAFFAQSGAKKPKAKLARVVMPDVKCGSPKHPPKIDNAPEAKAITGWSAHEDFPMFAREVDVQLEDDFVADALFEACEGGDKLGGWPKWIQDMEYPSCPECGEDMNQFVYQLTSEGDNGCTYCGDGVAYVCQCPKHPTQVDELAQQ